MFEKILADLSGLGKLTVSFLIAIPIGWNQELEDHTAGLRTLPLVSLGSCGLILVANTLMNGAPDSNSRILQGLMTGIGFVGGGAILKSEKSVHGTATAASIWNIGVIGAAVGYGRYDIAIIMAVISYIALRVLLPLKRKIDLQS